MNDLKFAFRQLLKNPGFTAVAALTLALCLGANLTIFAVVDSILLRSLPYPNADRLVTIYHSYPKANVPRADASLTTYYERRGGIAAFASLAGIDQTTSVVGETGATTLEKVGRVTPEFFPTLGVELFMGRAFTDDEMTYQTDHVAIISHEYWRNHFNSDPDVLGRSVRLAGIPRVIIGVLPPGFRFLSFTAPIYSPLSSEEAERNLGARHNNTVIQVARLAQGATLAEAQAQLDAHNNARAAEFPQAQMVADAGYRAFVAPLHADHVASARPTLLLLQGGVLLLLLIGGVNLVNLLLIRASTRARELAIRQSMGASRRHVVGHVMTETVLLSVFGGLLGLAVGEAGIRLLEFLGVDQLPLGARIAFNGRLALVALLGAVVLGIVIAVPVVWFNLRGHLANTLQSDSRGGTTSPAAQRLRHSFIVVQIALAFVLLAGAGLLGLSLKRVMAVSPGFRVDHVITGQFSLPWSGYHDLSSFHLFFDRLYEKTRSLPGVTAAGAVSNVPLNGNRSGNVMTIPGYTPGPGESVVTHDQRGVAGDYFVAMGIPLREGRFLNQSDVPIEQLNCVVDENFARRYWPDGSALGKQLYRGATIETGDKPYTIVGVVGAVKQDGLTEKNPTGAVYFSYSQIQIRGYFLVARTPLPPESLSIMLLKTIRAIDPELPLTDLRSMEARVADSLVARRSPALLAGIFAATALLLAAIGTYGVLSFAVTQRRREIGVRMALGAVPGQIAAQFLSLGLRLLAVGTILGVAGAWLVGRATQSMLFGVGAIQPGVLAATAGMMLLVVLLAVFLPSRRAAKVDPMEALRNE